MTAKDKKEKSRVREIVDMILYMICVLVLTWLVITFLGQRTVVSGDSMNDTLQNKDNLIVDKISYRFKQPERFDIVVFPNHQDNDNIYIKRIIGLPGEEVRIDENSIIYINGEELEESYGLQAMRPDTIGRGLDGVVLGEDEYFMLGDNRNNSLDSRSPNVGNVKRDDIIGKAWIRVWPLNEFAILKHQ